VLGLLVGIIGGPLGVLVDGTYGLVVGSLFDIYDADVSDSRWRRSRGTDLDLRDHEAMIALDESGEGVGVARYVRNNPPPDTAEVAVTVVDGWQGRGLGTLLLQAISARARRGRPHVHGVDAGP
jgi:GNAT superfamily N-acetyltransferase